ncbi:MAG: site-2 protease family protein [Desulfuromonadaceae bacterium]
MSPVVLILAVIICITVSMFVHVWSMALAGWLVGADIQEVSVGFGPRMLRFKTGTASINVNYIPTGGSVKFGDSFQNIHPIKRIFISAAGCLGLLCLASISFGIPETFLKFQNGFGQFVYGALSPRSVGKELLYVFYSFLKDNTFFACIALTSTKIAAVNMMPLPTLNGGDIVLTLIGWIKPIPSRLREYLQQFGLLIMLTLLCSWIVASCYFFIR